MGLSNPVSRSSYVTGSGSPSFTITSDAFTPPANSIVIVCIGYQSPSAANHFSISADTIGGLTWALVDGSTNSASGGASGGTAIFSAVAGSSPPTGTVTLSASSLGGATRCGMRVFTVTGQDPTSPIGAHCNIGTAGTGSSGSLEIDFDIFSTAPAASSLVIYVAGGYVDLAAPTVTDDSAFTRLTGVDSTDGWSWTEVAYCNGGCPTRPAPSWSATSSQSNMATGVEIKQAAPAVLPVRNPVSSAAVMRAATI